MKTSRPTLLTAVILFAAFTCSGFVVWSVMHANSRDKDKSRTAPETVSSAQPNHSSSSDEGRQMTIETASGPISLGAEPVRVALAPAEGQKLASRLESLQSDKRLYLVLKNLCAKQQPGVLFHLYMDLPSGTDKDEAHYVGSLNFFNSIDPGCSGSSNAAASPYRSYDITGLAETLHASRFLTDQTTVTILPAGVPSATATAIIGRIELLEQ